jgi:flagellin-like protein
MFELFNTEEERGQVGIGTLIVFIALVLVAAIAAGVLINTAGFLQTQAQSTGEESTEQVSTNLVYLSTTGAVNTTSDGTPTGISSFNTTVQLGPGSSAINLNDSTISVFTDDGVSAEFDGANSTNAGIELQNNNEVLSTDSSADGATATIQFNIGSGKLNGGITEFEAGTAVNIVITTPEGTQAETSFIIEDPLDPQLSDGDQIRLG